MAEKVIIDLEVKSNKGVKNVEKLNTEISKTNKEVKKTNEELAGASNSLDKFSGGAVSKIKNFGGAIKGLTTGFKSLSSCNYRYWYRCVNYCFSFFKSSIYKFRRGAKQVC